MKKSHGGRNLKYLTLVVCIISFLNIIYIFWNSLNENNSVNWEIVDITYIIFWIGMFLASFFYSLKAFKSTQ